MNSGARSRSRAQDLLISRTDRDSRVLPSPGTCLGCGHQFLFALFAFASLGLVVGVGEADPDGLVQVEAFPGVGRLRRRLRLWRP
jgi:hypothetical protein